MANQEKGYLKEAFLLWFALRHTTGSSWICGEDKLGMEPVSDPSYPLGDRISIPRMIIAQFDAINKTTVLKGLQKSVLCRLARTFTSMDPEHYFTVYLITFILLNEVAFASADRARHARANCIPVSSGPARLWFCFLSSFF